MRIVTFTIQFNFNSVVSNTEYQSDKVDRFQINNLDVQDNCLNHHYDFFKGKSFTYLSNKAPYFRIKKANLLCIL